MASFVSIRGWIECAPDFVNAISSAVQPTERGTAVQPPPEIVTEYMLGWRFPDRTFNWTSYIFFGMDMRDYYLDWFRDCVTRAAQADPESEGWFRLDGEHVNCWWRVLNGEVIESAHKTRNPPEGR